MPRKHVAPLLFSLLFCFQIIAQPAKPGSAEIHSKIRKLNFLGSVLYIAAHPDDENTRLITWLANDKKARTAYLSLTRGDGGQNLIGPELRELLGVIRTQELLEARKIDGGLQFFTRANDFGYSKTPNETLKIWNKDDVLADMIRVIRQFQPDVIINRFDARTPGTTHGHHTASAMLSVEAFDLAGNPSVYKTSESTIQPWQPKRLYMNTSWWFYGSKEKFDKADKSKMIRISTGTFYPETGKSNQEIAALSRSSHKSQGFGSSGARGADEEYLELLKGDSGNGTTDLFYGIDTSWNRVENGKPIGQLIAKIDSEYDYAHPEKSIPNLVRAHSMILALKDGYWKTVKLAEIKDVIASCSGLFLEAAADVQQVSPGDQFKLKLEAINRSDASMKLESVSVDPIGNNSFSTTLENNTSHTSEFTVNVPRDFGFTQSYWLVEKGSVGMYDVKDKDLIGKAESPRIATVRFNVSINNVIIPYDREIIYKFTDDVKGEVYTPFDIVPAVTMTLPDKSMVFTSNAKRNFTVKVLSEKSGVSGKLVLKAGAGWKIEPAEAVFSSDKSRSKDFEFSVTPPTGASESELSCMFITASDTLKSEKLAIDYPHIKKQLLFREAKARLVKPDIVIGNQKIAYIMGAGDQVPGCLRQMGYAVTQLTPDEITAENLKRFDVVITGIRAYNVVKELSVKQSELLDFVSKGGTMIVQYNTLDELVTPDMSPYKLKLSRDRVTQEDCEVKFIDSKNQLLNYPNKLTSSDFTGWVQERGLYFPNEWSKEFQPVIAMKDDGESSKEGAILTASFGKGTYIYTGISFFRELPEGVSGAYRLMANLISATQKNK